MTFRRSALLVVVISLFAFFARPLWADDLADEADLHFKLAFEKYAARDFRGALEHFLVSNRLVPNRNVIFNIARTYEQMGEYPDAFRYYVQALDLEPDASKRPRIEESIARIQPNVGVIKVTTDPPGATVYIDRRDLGPRGSTPRLLGFNAGKYKVIVDLEGYEPAEVDNIDAKLGETKTISLKLKRIVGKVRVVGETAGATVRVDDPSGPTACTAPCELTLAPGRHRLYLRQPGFQDSEQDVTVAARAEIIARYRLNPLSGSLVVNADERDALVEVDGKPVGFTPAVLSVQSGTRKVKVSLRGFRTIEQTVNVVPNQQTRVDVSLRQLEEVEAASRTAEAAEDAPGSITVIPSQELRAMGYSTLAEAVRGVRGLYSVDDKIYNFVGIRGIQIPGDQGNKVLVLLNGVPMNDAWANLTFADWSLRTDLEDVERIEIVRGPGSILYGTGAFAGVINIVTKGRPTQFGGSVGVGTSDNALIRARGSVQVPFGRDSGMWASVGAGRALGRDIYLAPDTFRPDVVRDPSANPPESDPRYDPNVGYSRNADDFNVGTFQGRLFVKSLSAQWALTSRSKTVPTGPVGTRLNNDETVYRDTRGFVEVKFEPRFSDKLAMMTRGALNYSAFSGDFNYQEVYLPTTKSTAIEKFNGIWGVVEQRFVISPIQMLRFTVGGEAQLHFVAEQRGEQTDCESTGGCTQYLYLPDGVAYDDSTYDKHPYNIFAGYALVDFIPSERLRVSAGARFDYYSYSDSPDLPSGINPRVALIAKPYEQGNLKIVGGTAFRAPSFYERFYALTDYQIAPDDPQPERVISGEVEFTHRFSTTVSATGAGYVNYLTNLIDTREVPNPEGGEGTVNQYYNTPGAVLVMGGEAELRREWRQGWMASISYSYTRARYVDQADPDADDRVPNSPEHMGSVRGAIPIFGRAVTLATRLTAEAPRLDTNFDRTDPALIWDLVVSGDLERGGLHYNVGVYNVTDWRYSQPVTPEMPISRVPQNGRTFLVSASLNF